MLYKPYLGSPNLETITSTADGTVGLSVCGLHSSEIFGKCRLGLSGGLTKTFKEDCDGDNFYYYNTEASSDITADCYNLTLKKPKDSMFKKNTQISWKARLYEAQSFTNDDLENNFPFIKDDTNDREGEFNYALAYADASRTNTAQKSYSDDMYYCTSYVPTSWIAYGSISEASTLYIYCSKDSPSVNGNYYRCSPSRQYYWNGYCDAYSDGYYLLKIFPHDFHGSRMLGTGYYSSTNGTIKYISGYDDYYARYYIKIGGTYYKILDWRYYDWRRTQEPINTITPADRLKDTSYFDGYGNALAMYVLIKAPDLSPNDIIGTEYTIYSNYVDTENYSFQISDAPQITFHDVVTPETAIELYSSKTAAAQNIYELPYSKLELSGSYSQSSGAWVSCYNATLTLEDGTIVDKTGNIFSPTIKYSFDELLAGETYILYMEITDNRNVMSKFYLYISPTYETKSNLIKAELSFNQENNSVIIDFSKLFSISPEISEDGYKYNESDGSVSVLKGNTLTYNKCDDTNNPLDFSAPLFNFVFRTDSMFIGEIFHAEDDNGNIYDFEWDGQKFICEITAGDTVQRQICSPYPTSHSLSDMISKMQSDGSDVSVRYLWDSEFSNTTYDESLYWHTETPSDYYWWSVIISQSGECLIKNVSTDNSEWIEGAE